MYKQGVLCRSPPPPQGSSELVLRKLKKIAPKIRRKSHLKSQQKFPSVNGPLGQENVLNRPFEINFVVHTQSYLVLTFVIENITLVL